jgi:hypothetical protein
VTLAYDQRVINPSLKEEAKFWIAFLGVGTASATGVTLAITAVMGAVRQLAGELQGKGYTTVVIQGLRYSGAKPGMTQTIIVDLTKLTK